MKIPTPELVSLSLVLILAFMSKTGCILNLNLLEG